MSEAASLHEMLTETVNEYLAANGGGIPNGFIYVVNYIDGNGTSMYEVASMEDQSPVLSSGLMAYMKAVCDAWLQDFLYSDEEVE